MRNLRLRAWERWQTAAGPWRAWAICPALVLPEPFAVGGDGSKVQQLTEKSLRLSVELEASLPGNGGTAVIADLDPLLGVNVAAHLNQLQLANAVLVLPRWPYDEAILPITEMVAVLIQTSQTLKATAASNVVFVLDAERKRSIRNRPESDPRADNRYDLTLADLPNMKTLRAAGVQRIIKLSHQ